MTATKTPQPGDTFTDEQVSALDKTHQPWPLEPFPYNQPAPRQGQPLSRRSSLGERWCPFCQTVLEAHHRACPPCRAVRETTMERSRGGRVLPVVTAEDNEQVAANVRALLDAIDEMSRVIGVASAHQNVRGRLNKSQVDDMFMACKTVMVMAEPVRESH